MPSFATSWLAAKQRIEQDIHLPSSTLKVLHSTSLSAFASQKFVSNHLKTFALLRNKFLKNCVFEIISLEQNSYRTVIFHVALHKNITLVVYSCL